MENTPLEVQVATLTERLNKAEGAIGYLLQVVGQLQADLHLVKFGVAPPPPAPVMMQMPTADRPVSGAYENEINRARSIEHVAPSSLNNGTSQANANDIWQFGDNMELDWDELGLLDDDPISSSKNLEPDEGAAGKTGPTVPALT